MRMEADQDYIKGVGWQDYDRDDSNVVTAQSGYNNNSDNDTRQIVVREMHSAGSTALEQKIKKPSLDIPSILVKNPTKAVSNAVGYCFQKIGDIHRDLCSGGSQNPVFLGGRRIAMTIISILGFLLGAKDIAVGAWDEDHSKLLKLAEGAALMGVGVAAYNSATGNNDKKAVSFGDIKNGETMKFVLGGVPLLIALMGINQVIGHKGISSKIANMFGFYGEE